MFQYFVDIVIQPERPVLEHSVAHMTLCLKLASTEALLLAVSPKGRRS